MTLRHFDGMIAEILCVRDSSGVMRGLSAVPQSLRMIARGFIAESVDFQPRLQALHWDDVGLDRYGHLMPGNEVEAAGLLDAFLSASAE